MKIFKRNVDDKRRLDSMSSEQKSDMIKRLERERRKINSEIESILRSYAKESGNRSLKRRRAGRAPDMNEWLYIYEK